MNTIVFLTSLGKIDFISLDGVSIEVCSFNFHLWLSCSGKGLKIMNLGDIQRTDGVASVLQEEDDDAVDPHLVRVKNEAGGDESDEEVVFLLVLSLMFSVDAPLEHCFVEM